MTKKFGLLLVLIPGVVIFPGCSLLTPSPTAVGKGLTSEYGTPYAGGRYMCINGACVDREKRKGDGGME